MSELLKIKTLGALKKSKYESQSIKDEMRTNLIESIKNKKKVFEGVMGFEDTVIPDLERAILSRHNILLLGLRGQAKTRLARLMINLLDEYIPVVEGSEINDDPLNPISHFAKELIEEKGDKTPISWLHRSERYVEKLATPDVSVADLIGDIDPIKAATLKLSYADERVIHFGLVPRSHRCLFVINELPDLQARIQVSLFNILQEGDMQIRGFKLRLPLDIEFVFTANPEDYTNRGSIITPLKDRVESQILTHYPTSIEIGKTITAQEARLSQEQSDKVIVPEVLKNILERIAIAARQSEYIDEKSGVSARLTIAAYENLVSTAERRMILNGEKQTTARLTDFWGVIPAITGKVELVYEGEQEGPLGVAVSLIDEAIQHEFDEYFPNPEENDDEQGNYSYRTLSEWFATGKQVELGNDISQKTYIKSLENVPGLKRLATKSVDKIQEKEIPVYMELILFGLSGYNIIQKEIINKKVTFGDELSDFLGDLDDDDFFS